ncbi:DUF4178 domain-containing protein [Rivularia sp. UHCC 0363]|uniref:DUF4178 domain-containing protein n=1 Tax=Rivularia sp. UHCC 0363 TaxID=3110244 RepID=UPI002B1F57DF|nr:DUF4178 domain-containing protein [Rivularia sp. UHCC 0363]MEA5597030.1 DUF4178 domain-containing protein [Rivularia sp. UHCC 0363]
MTLLIWLGVIVIVAGGAYLLVLQQRGALPGSKPKELPSLKRNVFNLQIGDIVQHLGIDWVVEGKLTYKVDEYSWMEYMLQDNNEIRWLSVDEDDNIEVALLQASDRLDISQTPPPRQLNFADENYKCVDSGIASMTRVGTVQRRTAQTCKYFDYEGSGDKVLSIEIWDGETEVTVGHRINPRSLTILPGDGNRVYGL